MTTALTQDARIVTTRSVRWRAKAGVHIQTIAIGAILLVLVAFFAVAADEFSSASNMLNIGRQIAPMLIVAVAMTFVITTGGIDLSVGSTVALTGSLLALLIAAGWDPTLTLFAVLLVGAAIGALNGYVFSYGRVPAFITTLATMSIVRGTALRATEGYSTPITADSWVVSIGQGRILGTPTPAIIALAVTAIGWWVYNQMGYGRYVVGFGSNREAVRRAGVDVRRIGMSVYLLTAGAAALAGIMIATRLQSGSSNAGVGLELEAITAVALGGTNLLGGRGSIVGTLLGALVLGVIANGLVLLGVSPYYVQITQGAILLLAIFANHRFFSRLGAGG
jgi:simple sugar transport system permease protein